MCYILYSTANMRFQKYKLRDIADLNLGFSFRSSLILSDQDTPTCTLKSAVELIKVIQLKNIDACGELIDDNLDQINFKPNRSNKSLEPIKKGDIIFCPRGHKLVSVLIKKNWENTIISAPLIWLSIKCPDNVMPEYLHFYLNSSFAKKQYQNLLRGSTILTLKKTDLDELEILIPSPTTQKAFAESYQYFNQEKKLREKILELRKKLIEKTLNHKLEELITTKGELWQAQ